jgi:hypothetical protein
VELLDEFVDVVYGRHLGSSFPSIPQYPAGILRYSPECVE